MKSFWVVGIALLSMVSPAQADVNIQKIISPGGIKAWLVQEASIPFTALEIRFRGGASLDRPDKRGSVYLMTGLLEEGAGDLDARGFAREAENLAASFQYGAYDDQVSISARFLTENRAEAVDLLRTSLLEPRFDDDAIERVRAQILSGIRSSMSDQDEIAAQEWRALVFADHPYGSAYEGTVESVSALGRDDLLTAHGDVFARDRLYVGAAGDISPDELGQILDQLFSALPATGAVMPPQASINIPAGVSVTQFSSPQSVVIFGHAGIGQTDPDYFAARLLNRILGAGGFESRLMQEVREKRGLTYGVYSHLATREHGATYEGSLSSANDKVAEAISVIRSEWTRTAAGDISQDDLERAKTYMTGAYPLQFDGNGAIAGILVALQILGLPLDYIATRNDKVKAVTLADVRRVAAQLLNPGGLHFIVVGEPKDLSSGPLPE